MKALVYKGSGPAIVDEQAGHTDLMLDVVLTSLQQIRAGRLKAMGISSLKRSPLLPDVPTLAEQGFPGLEVLAWYGLFAPAGTARNSRAAPRRHGGGAKWTKD